MAYEIHLLPGQSINNFGRGEELETFVGTLKAGELVKRCQIPHRDYDRDIGYQRNATKNRVNLLSNSLLAGERGERMVDLPTALLLSVRDSTPRPKLDSTGRYVLTLPENSSKPFYVVDGQHRVEALQKVIGEEGNGFWSNYRIPAVIFFGADEAVEMIHFHTVNSNAKSIKADLDMDLLERRARGDKRFLDTLPRKQEWKVHAQRITDQVAKRGVWVDRVRFSNQPKGATVITSNSFASSLKPALDQVIFSIHSLDDRVRIVDAYWRGVEKVLPECFRAPRRYNIQKTVGAFVLHDLLSLVLQQAKDVGDSIYHPDTYAGIFCKMLQEFRDVNLLGEAAVGSDFWKAGNEGAAGVYSSGSGRQRLAQRMGKVLQEEWRQQ